MAFQTGGLLVKDDPRHETEKKGRRLCGRVENGVTDATDAIAVVCSVAYNHVLDRAQCDRVSPTLSGHLRVLY